MIAEREIGEDVTLTTRHEANEKIDKAKRQRQILTILTRPMTAKEVAVEMYRQGLTDSADRNNAAPRLTEMSKDGRVEPVGKKRCSYTGKTVAVYARREA